MSGVSVGESEQALEGCEEHTTEIYTPARRRKKKREIVTRRESTAMTETKKPRDKSLTRGKETFPFGFFSTTTGEYFGLPTPTLLFL